MTARRSFLLGGCAAFLSACAPRANLRIISNAPPDAIRRRIYVATNRPLHTAQGIWGNGLSADLAYGRFDVLIPEGHVAGSIETPEGNARVDPKRHFAVTEALAYRQEAQFRAVLRQDIAADPAHREAMIYIHGFNNTFGESLYRAAQLAADVDLPALTVHYAWPSLGNPLGYVADRDRSTFAREGLRSLMGTLVEAGVKKIYLVGHSMGGALTMDVLRDIGLAQDNRLKSHIGGVIFISPDLNVDVFRLQAQAYGPLPQPFVIFGTNRDKLLSLSAMLTAQPDRLGNLKSLQELADLNITFIDTSAYTEGAGHFNVGDNPALLKLLGRMVEVNRALDTEAVVRTGLLPGVALGLQNATAIILGG